jgi:CRP-like cAMP-binding protein
VEHALLAGLSDADRRGVLATLRRRKFARREVIFHEGDAGESVHLVDSGHVGIRITTPAGDVALVRIVGPGGFFGELALLTPGPRTATAIALEGAQTLTMSREQLDELRRASSSASDMLVTALAVEVRRLAAAHVEALYLPADKRVYRRLLDAARAYGATPPIAIPLTQDEIAQLAGTTRPTANQLLGEAQEAGAITLARGRIEVADLAWLERHGR